MTIKITTLIENNQGVEGLVSEHGLSFFIEVEKKNILFDTGYSGIFINNAKALDIDLNNIQYVILSHGHDDHTGGFNQFVNTFNKSYQLILGEGFFNPKYKYVDDEYIFDGNPFDQKLIKGTDYILVHNQIHQLDDFLFVKSSFTYQNDFELPNKIYYIKNHHSYYSDDFQEEVVLIIKHPNGLVVFLGCSHVGVVNILESIKKTMKENIYAVFGGTHLVKANKNRIDKTIEYFNQQDIKIAGLCHCTGETAIELFKNNYKGHFITLHTGDYFEL